MRKRVELIVLILLFAVSKFNLNAQRHSVTAKMDSIQIWIGQQTKLSFEYTQELELFVQTPLFSDKIIDGVEVVERLENDTIHSPDGYLSISQSYIITSFEDSLLLIPSFPFIMEEDTIWSNELSLKVIQPFEIDLEDIQAADIKNIFRGKFSLLYFFKKILPWLLALLLVAGLIYLIYYLIKNRKKDESLEHLEPPVPPYELAISGLEKIKEEKLWQQGRHKEYHSELTDILRVYLEGVFEISAMEMTSDEILLHFNELRRDNKQVYSYLEQILRLADLVKFAKWNVGHDEHELSLNNAFSFVNETRVEEEVEEEIKEETEEDDIS